MNGAPTVCFIGAGNMAEALVRGMLAEGAAAPEAIRVSDPSAERRNVFEEELGVTATADNMSAARDADVVFLAVKPQQMEAVLSAFSGDAGERLWVSIAAGVRSDTLGGWLGGDEARMIRVMPNTPALVGVGAAVMSPNTHATEADAALVESLLAPSGLVLRMPEEKLDAVTALSGSGPAYVFLLAEAMADAGEKLGLEPEAALRLATQTIRGAGVLLAGSDEGPRALRERVTSKGGTTAAALQCFDAGGFGALVTEAMQAAADRSRELSEPE